MFNRYSDPDQIVTEDSDQKLVLARPNFLRTWGAVSLALALVSAVGTFVVGIYWLGIPVVLAYLVLGVLLVLSDRTITFDAAQGVVIFSTRLATRNWQTGAVSIAQIASIYLDFEEDHDYSAWSFYTPREKIVRKWRIFLVLRDRRTVTVVRQVYNYSPNSVENRATQTVSWEKLAERLCLITDKLLVRTPTVPGRAPHTFVEVVNQIVQRRLAVLPETDVLKHRSIRLRSHPTGGMEIVVDGVNHRELDEIDDPAVDRFIREAVDEWQSFVGGYPADPLQPHTHEPNPEPPSADPAFSWVDPSGQEMVITVDDLEQLPHTTVSNCYVVSTGHGTSGPFTFGGVSLLDLARSQLHPATRWRQLEVVSADGFGNRILAAELLSPRPPDRPIILSTMLDGKKMTREQGLVRLIVPSEKDDALRQVKWVDRIVVRD